MKKIILAVIAVAAATLACGLPASSTPTPQSTSNILFADDFSSIESGWAQLNEDARSADYSNGGYRMWLNTPQYDIWTYTGKTFGDPVSIEVDATKTAGPDDNDYGVICNFQDSDNFYFGLISSDGFALVGKEQDGKTIPLSSDQMQPVDGILPGNVTNHIKFECINGTLTLYANGNLLATATDTSFTGGDVGLRIGTYDVAGLEIIFDNFVVLKP